MVLEHDLICMSNRRSYLKGALAVATGGVALATATVDRVRAATFELGEVVHTTTALNVRDGPGTGYTIIDTEPARMRGQVFDGPVYADGYEWYEVEYDTDRIEDQATGWSARGSDWLRAGKDYSGWKFLWYDGVHTTTSLNVRDGPGTGYDVIDTADAGATGTIVGGPEYSDGYTWWKVDYHDYATGWSADDGWLVIGTLSGCRSAWNTDDNEWALGKIITSEAGRYVANDTERTAVAYSVLNRMDRNGTTDVTDEWDAYAHSKEPSSESLALARDVLTCSVADESRGATHFYSPQSMPKEGEDTSGYDTGGGLEWTPGLDDRNYRPSWSVDFPRCYVPDAVQKRFKFYRAPGNGPV